MADEQTDDSQHYDEPGDTESRSQTAKQPEDEEFVAIPVPESEIDVVGEEDDDSDFQMVMPTVTLSGEVLDSSLRTPTKESVRRERELDEEEEDTGNREKVFSSFPCQVIPETLARLTRTPPDGEHLEVQKNKNGRLRIYVIDHSKKFSPYSNLTHKPCTVCSRLMKSGEMHLNFPADLDRRRIWANLLGFKYKDILRSKMGPVSISIAAGPICTEHFAEECFRNHNFNKSAIEAFGVPVAISPDVKTTPSKKSSRVPWVCTICDFHSCSVVELQSHLLDHTETMLKKKDNVLEVPEAGFMCPFCRKCTYGYKTITGYRRHLNAAPIHHCHLRRIYEFAKMNCRASELEPIEKWDNWTRRNVYVAYHGCEPPANEVVLTPSPTKSVYNPEERTRLVQDEDRRRKAVRSLAFVGKEGGTSVNDHNVMQRAVYLQVRRNMEHQKRFPEDEEEIDEVEEVVNVDVVEEVKEKEEEEDSELVKEEKLEEPSPQLPMGAEKRKSRRLAASVTSSPVKKSEATAASCPTTPAKKKRKMSSEEKGETQEELDRKREERDARFAQMVQKRSQQAKRLMSAKQLAISPKKPRKALAYQLVKGAEKAEESSDSRADEGEDEEEEESTPSEQTPEPTTSAQRRTSSRNARKKSKTPTPPPQKLSKRKEAQEVPKPAEEPEERQLKSMLARGLSTGVRFSMAKYHVQLEDISTTSAGPLSGKSLSTGSIKTSSSGLAVPKSSSSATSSQSPMGAVAPKTGGLFSRVHSHGSSQEKGPSKRPTVLGRRPLILSPRKRAPPSSSSSGGSSQPTHHESSPILSVSAYEELQQVLIPAKEMNVELVAEVIEDQLFATDDHDMPGASSSDTKPMTLAEALDLKSGMAGETVKDQELEEISKEMMKESHYYRAMEDAIKCKTVTKMRADMRLSRHCIRQIEAARARARLFGEGSEDYQILYSHDGAQVVPRSQLHQAPDDTQQQ